VVKTRYGVDEEICTGDHSCIRLSGCPSLTVKPNPDPLRTDPVATVIESCVGCGLCGEVAHAAVLCPSFYRVDVVHNPNAWDRSLHTVPSAVIGWFDPTRANAPPVRGAAAPSSLWAPQGGGEQAGPRPTATPASGTREFATTHARPLTLLIA